MGGQATPPPFADLIGRDPRSTLATGAAPAAAPPAPAPESLPAVLTPGGARGPLSGASWEDYLVGDLIAAGGMGEVYRAVQRPMGRVVALKVIPAQGAAEAVRRFRAEARAVAMIQHPNVVAVYASGERDGRPFLAMELLTGGTLADRLALRRAEGAGFSPYEAADLVLQAARGLAAAHACELVHRDLKPANLLFAGDGALKVCDFGLARMPGDGSRTLAGTVLGTPLYMSPEQGRGLPATTSSDVYSLGVVLYELLTMAPPFEAAQAEALVLQHNFSEPALPSARRRDLPAALEAVCLKCLQKRPQDRFADAAALVADLERVRAGLAPLSALFPPGQMRTGAEEALRRLSGRRRWWRVAAAAGVAAAAAAALLWWREGHRERTAAARSRLEVLLAPAPIPASSAADLDLLARQVGDDDPLVAQGRAKLARVAELEAALARLAESPPASAGALQAGDRLAADLAALVGEGSARVAGWRRQRTAADEAAAGLRRDLAALDRGPLASAPRQAARRDLARLTTLAGADADTRRWSGLLDAADAEEEALRARLGRLARPAPPTAAELDALAADLDRLRLLAPEEPGLTGQAARLAEERAAIAALLAAADRLSAQDDDLGPVARGELADAVAALEQRQALPEALGRRARDRLAASARTIAGLAERLAVLDAPRSIPQDLGGDLARYEALAGYGDPAGRTWRARYDRITALQSRLSALLAARHPPAEGADADLAELAGLVGHGDALVAAAGARLRRIAELRAGLAADLDRARPIPEGAQAALAALAELAGEDAAVRRWQGKLARWRQLAEDLDAFARRWVADDGALTGARRLLDEAAGLAGADAPALAAWRGRIAALAGPARPGWAAAAGRDGHGPWAELQAGGVVQRLRWLPPGDFLMGSPAAEPGRDADEEQVPVRLERGIWIADSECSQELWRAVMGAAAGAWGGPGLPVTEVSALQAEGFCRRLSALLPGCAARLPSEAEWEAAARAGDGGARGGLPAPAAGAGPAAAAGGPANALGLHHAPGNVWEWCGDGYGPPPAGPLARDPRRAVERLQALRGGSWGDGADACRVANRHGLPPDRTSPLVGFRFAIEDAPAP